MTHLPSDNQTYMELRNRTVGRDGKSNTVIMQRSQYKILKATANTPRYVTNHAVQTDFNFSYVSDVINERINKHHNNPQARPNTLLQPLLQTVNSRRLRSCWRLDLQGTWYDVAGQILYHLIVINGIVAHFV